MENFVKFNQMKERRCNNLSFKLVSLSIYANIFSSHRERQFYAYTNWLVKYELHVEKVQTQIQWQGDRDSERVRESTC